MNHYYLVGSLAKRPAYAERSWYDRFRQTFPCLHRKPSESLDVVVQELGQDTPLNFVQGVVINYARTDFLEALGIDPTPWLCFGNLLNLDADILNDYRTLGSHSELQIRGGPRSTRTWCAKCGRFLYYAIGDLYVLSANVTGQPIYYPTQGFLVINADLHARLIKHKWKSVYFIRLPVLEKPRDDLPCDFKDLHQRSL
jgi:hypothetical protein